MSGGKKTQSPRSTTLNRVKLVRGGKPYFDCLLDIIESARQSIHLQTYIYDDDETGELIASALKAAVKRNVQVYLLADGYASKAMSRSFINGLTEGGIHFRFFDPIFKSRYLYFGRRLHHKVVVVDGSYALVGGINITNRYNDRPGKPAWLDFALYTEGEAARQLCLLCWKSWNNFYLDKGRTPCDQMETHFTFQPHETCNVSLQRNDWVRRKNEISTTYVNMIRNATSHIVFLCSYFLPGSVISKQLSYATKRGVNIKVITAGISDVRMAKYAERHMYDWLLKNNIELYEYQPGILHGKIAVCDSQWLTIGSYNINNISAYASIELNMNVYNPAFSKGVEKTLQQIIDTDCIRITKEWQSRTKNPLTQLIQWLSHELVRFTLFLFTFYFKHKN